ncbi:hypothetical protein QIH87_50225 (plasmid) [Bradyrhizobium elkanii]|uniref:hypothetical protein n=1 Tax=Bradyrhizobium elkanii TaxID=29448 RepID=UPI002714DB36|nr:hypothetical protein [Bradyrhizobium elkanii]WLB14809.1 hypothetical protein QIH87_50225 [Bradyrhizobium elkanii]WLB69100.1 hypothetical protein QIH89_27690 [Bradyrhizobium elkanii]
MSDNDNGTVTPLNLPRDPLEATSEQLIRNAASIARFRKKLFDEYCAVGFTVDQALILCTK